MRILGNLAALSVMALIFGNSASALSLSFEPADARFEAATQEYREIWSAHGVRIEKLLEEATSVSLRSERISVVVFEGISSSGEAGKPMRMRASYAPAVKRATLVHELTHRYLDALDLDPTCFDDIHDVVSLVLARVWEELWGREFVEEQSKVEIALSTRYAEAWTGVLEMNGEERARRLAGVLSSCRRPTMQSTRFRNRLFYQTKLSCRNGLMRRWASK